MSKDDMSILLWGKHIRSRLSSLQKWVKMVSRFQNFQRCDAQASGVFLTARQIPANTSSSWGVEKRITGLSTSRF